MYSKWVPVLVLVGGVGGCSDDGTTSSAGATTSTTTGGQGGQGGEGAGQGGGHGGGGACLVFGAVCDVAADTCCDVAGQTGQCFTFGMGPRCTVPCPADPADCPNDGEGCNNMGTCKAK